MWGWGYHLQALRCLLGCSLWATIRFNMPDVTIRQTKVFADWLRELRDERTKARITARLQRLAFGHFGDVRPVGEGVRELRIHYGPGYRVYFRQRGRSLVLLLCGGDKGSQQHDIARALELARQRED